MKAHHCIGQAAYRQGEHARNTGKLVATLIGQQRSEPISAALQLFVTPVCSSASQAGTQKVLDLALTGHLTAITRTEADELTLTLKGATARIAEMCRYGTEAGGNKRSDKARRGSPGPSCEARQFAICHHRRPC